MMNICSWLSLPLLISTQFCSTYHALASEVRYNLGLISWAWAGANAQAAQDRLIAARRQQLRFVDAQPGRPREQQLGVVLKVFDTDDHIHPRSADPAVNLREIEPFVLPPRFRLQLIPGLLKLQHRKLTCYMRDA
jgi:hypothetical protein